MNIEQQVWGFTAEPEGGKPVILYTMTNAGGATVRLTNYGAAIVGITVPDNKGQLADVVLGYDKWQSYVADGPAMGKSVGRYANRIAKGSFELDGKKYRLAVNNGPNHLHGGPTGFQNRLWESRVEGDRVVFSYLSEENEENYPGAVYVEACYDWNDDNELEVTYYARLTEESEARATPINLTNHVYFNLKGHDQGLIHDHYLEINASHFLPTDDTAIPTGHLQPVEGTPMDFVTRPRLIGERIGEDFDQLAFGKGYDHCWVIDNYAQNSVVGSAPILPAAKLYHPETGRYVEVSTTQPGIQIYTGNWLSGCPISKTEGYYYEDRSGVAMECQAFPDTPNQSTFPQATLRGGEVYEQHIVYRFGTIR